MTRNMNQGYSGSALRREGDIVVKVSSDEAFVQDRQRQKDLIALSQVLDVLPRIHRIDPPALRMDYIAGHEGFTLNNARRAGDALRRLHDHQPFAHGCTTGVDWLAMMAGDVQLPNDMRRWTAGALEQEYPADALILAEPQFIERQDGSIVFIDFEGMGAGSRYHDLAHLYFRMADNAHLDIFAQFLDGYQHARENVDLRRVMKLAGVVALAYARFAEPERRVKLGLRLLEEAGAT